MENSGTIRITIGGDTAFVASETLAPKQVSLVKAKKSVRRPKDPKPKE